MDNKGEDNDDDENFWTSNLQNKILFTFHGHTIYHAVYMVLMYFHIVQIHKYHTRKGKVLIQSSDPGQFYITGSPNPIAILITSMAMIP